MAKIIKLDEQLSNKIAAGEVVERPASIVKELVENAIDANSTQIIIDVEEGGLSKIRIVDNGDGIDSEDVETAFYRHATSKIKTDKDLFHIMTLGFRGEALPSIASVSIMEMNTCTGDGPGTRIEIEGGKILSKTTAKSRKGTEVLVTNLFYNTPARLKYVKTIHTELGNISDIVNRVALSHPNISFQLLHNGKEMLRTSGNGDALQVIAAIYGKAIAKNMLNIQGRSLDYTIKGYIAKPEITRAGRGYISTFINGRYVRNYALVRAIMEGYHTLLPIGRYPVVVIEVEMDPILIDVNVHPSKLEVRLSKEEELVAIVKEEIKRQFQQVQLIPNVTLPKAKKELSEQQTFLFNDTQETTKRAAALIKETPPVMSLEDKYSESALEVKEPEERNNQTKMEQQPSEELPRQTEYTEQTTERVPVLYPIGQLHGTYILAQNETGMYIIDQHAAQERLKYDYFKEKVGQTEANVQELLVPITFDCTRGEAIILEENLAVLKQVGLFLEPFGDLTFIVRAHPTWFTKGQEEETIKDLIGQVLRDKKVDIKKLREEAAILMACKAAIKANRHLRQDEMFALLEALRKCKDPFTCPHGRPIIVHFSSYDMEKMFKRVM